MAMRLTGLMSGMDTESIIQELVAARQTKVDTTKKAQTKLNWKQEAWNSLNTKIKNLQSKFINNMRLSTAYKKKTTSVSNSSAVSVITGANAVNGVQKLDVKQLAKTGYLTGAKIMGKAGDLTALSKVSDIVDGFSDSGTINITAGDKSVNINVTADTTISDILTQVKSTGLNASFDEKQQRFFISSSASGVENDFSITASDAAGAKALSALGLQVNLNNDKASLKEYKEYAGYFVAEDRQKTLDNMESLINASVASKREDYLTQYKSLQESLTGAQKNIDAINEKYKDSKLLTVEEYDTQLETKNDRIKVLQESLDSGVLTEEEVERANEELKTLKEEVTKLEGEKTDAKALATHEANVIKYNEQIAAVEEYVTVAAATGDDGSITYSAVETDKLIKEEESSFYNKAAYAAEVMANYDPTDTSATGATKVSGEDAIIYLNDAEFTNNDNVFEINGLTFTALSETKEGESVTITTQDDTEGIYDMIKDFLTEYNSVINEMDKLYNAESAKGYEPLTSEEKEAMAESDVTEWEKKVKDALLRRDDNLSTVSSALKSIMSSGFSVNGKTMYLSDFGINTLGYFEAADNEKNAYYIDGDEDNSTTAGKTDKLKTMISNDPDTIISFFTQLSQSMYTKMNDMSKSVEGYRTFGNFFDDKKMKSDYDDYTSKIKELEEKLTEYEDKWYSKFSAMETALAKMQSNVSAVTSLLGG